MTFWQYLSSDMGMLLIWGVLSAWSLCYAGVLAYKKDMVKARYELQIGVLCFVIAWRILATYQPLVIQ